MIKLKNTRWKTPLLGVCLVFGGMSLVTSCAPKYGCPINEETHVDFEKTKGKRGKTQLFDKKMSKRIKG